MDKLDLDLDRIFQGNISSLTDFVRHELLVNPNGNIKQFVVDKCMSTWNKAIDDYRSVKRIDFVVDRHIDIKYQGVLTNFFKGYNLIFSSRINDNLSLLKSFRLLFLDDFLNRYHIPSLGCVTCYGGDLVDYLSYFNNKFQIEYVESVMSDSLRVTFLNLGKALDNMKFNNQLVAEGGLLDMIFNDRLVSSYFLNFNANSFRKSSLFFSFFDFLSSPREKFLTDMYNCNMKFGKLYIPFSSNVLFSSEGDISEFMRYKIVDQRIRFYYLTEHLVFECDVNTYFSWVCKTVYKNDKINATIEPTAEVSGILELTVEFIDSYVNRHIVTAFANDNAKKKYVVNYRIYKNYKSFGIFDVLNPFKKYGTLYEDKKLFIDSDLIEKGKEYAYRVTADKFKPQELFALLQSHNRRWFIGGKDVLARTCVNAADELYIVAHAIYLDVYQKKYDMSKSLQINVDQISMSRGIARMGLLSKLFATTSCAISHSYLYQNCLFSVVTDTLNKLHAYVYHLKVGKEFTDDIIVSDISMKEFDCDIYVNNIANNLFESTYAVDVYNDFTFDMSEIYAVDKYPAVYASNVTFAHREIRQYYCRNLDRFSKKYVYNFYKKINYQRYGDPNNDYCFLLYKDNEVHEFSKETMTLLPIKMNLDDFLNYYTFDEIETNKEGYCFYDALNKSGVSFDYTGYPKDICLSFTKFFCKIFMINIVIYDVDHKIKYEYLDYPNVSRIYLLKIKNHIKALKRKRFNLIDAINTLPLEYAAVYARSRDRHYVQIVNSRINYLTDVNIVQNFDTTDSQIIDISETTNEIINESETVVETVNDFVQDCPPVINKSTKFEGIKINTEALVHNPTTLVFNMPNSVLPNNQIDCSRDDFDAIEFVESELVTVPDINEYIQVERAESESYEIGSVCTLSELSEKFSLCSDISDVDVNELKLYAKTLRDFSFTQVENTYYLITSNALINIVDDDLQLSSIQSTVFKIETINKLKLVKYVKNSRVYIINADDTVVKSYERINDLVDYIAKLSIFESKKSNQVIDISGLVDLGSVIKYGVKASYWQSKVSSNGEDIKTAILDISEFLYDVKKLITVLKSIKVVDAVLIMPTILFLRNAHKFDLGESVSVNYMFKDSVDYIVCIVYNLHQRCCFFDVKLQHINQNLQQIEPNGELEYALSEFYSSVKNNKIFSNIVTYNTCDVEIIVNYINVSDVARFLMKYCKFVYVINIRNNKLFIGVNMKYQRVATLTIEDILLSIRNMSYAFKRKLEIAKPFYSIEFSAIVSFEPSTLCISVVQNTSCQVFGYVNININEGDTDIPIFEKCDDKKYNLILPRAYLKYDINEKLQHLSTLVEQFDYIYITTNLDNNIFVKLFNQSKRILFNSKFNIRQSLLDSFAPKYFQGEYLTTIQYMYNTIYEIRETWRWTIKSLIDNVHDIHNSVIQIYENDTLNIESTNPSFGCFSATTGKWIIKPQRQLFSSYTHCFNGSELIDTSACNFSEDRVTNLPANCKYLSFTSDFQVVNSQYLYQSTSTFYNKNFKANIILHSGCPGSGKSTFILDNVKDGNLILCSTRAGVVDMKEKVKTKLGMHHQVTIKTGDSYLIHDKRKYKILYVDEGFMKHPGELLLYILYSECKEVHILGDCAQIPYINRLRQIQHSCKLKNVNLCEVYRDVSYRCPLDAVTIINSLGLYPFVVYSANHRDNTMCVKKIFSITNINQSYDVYLTFLQDEKKQLQQKGFNAFTVHEYQGQEAENIALVRLSPKSHEVFKSSNHVLVALSRHTVKLVYFTVDDSDYTSKLINNVITNVEYKAKLKVGREIECEFGIHVDYKPYNVISAHKVSQQILDHYFGSDFTNMKFIKTSKLNFYSSEPYTNVGISLDYHYLQDFVDSVYPSRSHYNRVYDAYIYDHSDVYVNIDNVNVSLAFSPVNYKTYAEPVLRTGLQPPVNMTINNLMYSYADRNGCVPNYMGIVHNNNIVEKAVKNFVQYYVEDINTFEKFKDNPILYDSNAIDHWLSTKDKSTFMTLKKYNDFCDSKLNVYEYLLKKNAKPKLDELGVFGFTSPQTISAHAKVVNSVFCPIVRVIKERLVSVLRKDVIINNDMSIQEFEDVLNIYANLERISEYSHTLEIDFSKYDKSQDYTCYIIEEKLLVLLGFPCELIATWRYASFISKLLNIKSRFTGKIIYQRKSGTAVTYLGNTLICMASLALVMDLSDAICLFSGDDSFIFSKTYLGTIDTTYDLSLLLNLDSKLLHYNCIYFCSKFLIPTNNGWVVVPDPMKILLKMGRLDLVDEEHVEMYRVSLFDNVKNFRNNEIFPILEDSMRDRYKTIMSVETLCLTIYDIVSDSKSFSKLFDTTKCSIHSSKPSLEL